MHSSGCSICVIPDGGVEKVICPHNSPLNIKGEAIDIDHRSIKQQYTNLFPLNGTWVVERPVVWHAKKPLVQPSNRLCSLLDAASTDIDIRFIRSILFCITLLHLMACQIKGNFWPLTDDFYLEWNNLKMFGARVRQMCIRRRLFSPIAE